MALAGCVAERHATWDAPAPSFGGVSDEIIAGLIRDGDEHWQKRGDAHEMDEAGRAWTAARRYQPADPQLLVRLGRLAYRRGNVKHAAAQLELAVQFAERALAARNPGLAAAARAGQPPEKVFALAEPADAPALALYAEALLAWAVARGTPTVRAQHDLIRAAAANALRFDRTLAWAAPDRVLGVLACEARVARQNLSPALEHFEAAVAAAPGYLPTRVLYAAEYAPRVRDAALQRRLLEAVVAADAHALPEAEPENREAQAAARRLLQRAQ
jgi:hypothetical protein